MWYGKLSRHKYLRIFICLAYACTNDGKLESQALKCIFVGYPEGVKGYKLCLEKPKKHKFFISRDITFNELQMARTLKKKIILRWSSEYRNLPLVIYNWEV